MGLMLRRWREAFVNLPVLPKFVINTLLLFTLVGTGVLSWRLLKDEPTLIAFLTLAVEALALFLTIFGFSSPSSNRISLERLYASGWRQIALCGLTLILWRGIFLWPPEPRQPFEFQEMTQPMTVEGLCTDIYRFDSLEDAKAYLYERAVQNAHAQLGDESSVRVVGVPQYVIGPNQGGVCIKAQFYTAESSVQP